MAVLAISVLSATTGPVVGMLSTGKVVAVGVLLDDVVIGVGMSGGSPTGAAIALVVVFNKKAVAPCLGL